MTNRLAVYVAVCTVFVCTFPCNWLLYVYTCLRTVFREQYYHYYLLKSYLNKTRWI